MPTHQHIVDFVSFGFKHSEPPAASFLFDARSLPNPFWEAPLKTFCGKDESIQQYFQQFEPVQKLIKTLEDSLMTWLTEFEASLPETITIAIGCTGGQHRSVYLAQTLADRLELKLPEQFTVEVRHRDKPYWA